MARIAVKRAVAGVTMLGIVVLAAGLVDGGVAAATPAEGPVRNANAAGAVKDNYIVVFKPRTAESGAVDAAAGRLARTYGGAVRHAYKSTVKGFSVRMTEKAARRLAANPAVAYVEQDRQIKLAGTQTSPPSWGLDRIDQPGLPLNGSYTYPNTAANVHAYIIDTGIRSSHSDFGGRVGFVYNAIGDGNDTDCNGHGTHVAGTVGGSSSGVAKAVQLVAVKVLDCTGTGAFSQIIAGVDWVTSNAVKPAVANMSLGGPADSAVDNAVKASIASGITYAVAAGNDNADACGGSPARVPEALTVGATDNTDARASFSDYGTCLDIFAPGVGIVSASNSGDTSYVGLSGTSMATPHVAGAAAVYLSAHPAATPTEVHDALVTYAAAGKVTNAGAGSPTRLLNITTATATPPPGPVPMGWGFSGAYSVVYAMDLDGDGRTELVVNNNGTLYAFHDNGYNPDGTVSWGNKVAIGWGFSGAYSVVYAMDLDGDGRTELVFNKYGTLYAFRNNGYNPDGTVSWG